MWQDFGPVFAGENGTPTEGTKVLHQFQRRLADAGLPRMRFHDLRHGAATLILAQGLTLGETQKVLGHTKNALTADLYAHAAPELMANAATRMQGIFGTG